MSTKVSRPVQFRPSAPTTRGVGDKLTTMQEELLKSPWVRPAFVKKEIRHHKFNDTPEGYYVPLTYPEKEDLLELLSKPHGVHDLQKGMLDAMEAGEDSAVKMADSNLRQVHLTIAACASMDEIIAGADYLAAISAVFGQLELTAFFTGYSLGYWMATHFYYHC